MVLERGKNYESVVMRLSVLRYMVKSLNKQGKTDLNRDCESFYAKVLSMVYGYDLINVNDARHNSAAIDLADAARKVCFQLSSTATAEKITKTIDSFVKHKLYETYAELRFLMLVDRLDYKKTFDTGGHFIFDAKEHVIDIDDLLDDVIRLDDARLAALCGFIEKQLPSVAKALQPNSLLANAEEVHDRPPATGKRMHERYRDGYTDDDWVTELASLSELQRTLMVLSENQRSIIFKAFQLGSEGPRRHITISVQTLTQKLKLSNEDMWSYYRAIERETRLMDIDDHDGTFELRWRLKASGSDAFVMLKEFLKEGEDKRLIVDCDFTVLD